MQRGHSSPLGSSLGSRTAETEVTYRNLRHRYFQSPSLPDSVCFEAHKTVDELLMSDNMAALNPFRMETDMTLAISAATPIVFVVDDEISIRESLELLLRSEGWALGKAGLRGNYDESDRVIQITK